MSALILTHPQVIALQVAAQLLADRLFYMQEAARFAAKGDYANRSWCQGKASGLNDAIVALGGEPISLMVGDYAEAV
jgi:hypothetical protein